MESLWIELVEWLSNPISYPVLAMISAKIASALLPNDNPFVKYTRWIALNVGQDKPGVSQVSLKRFVGDFLR